MRQAVHLDPDPRLLARLSCSGDHPDLLDQPFPEGERRHEQLAERAGPPEAGQVVEEVGDVGSDLLVGREEAEVLVAAGGDGVVVAGAEMDIAAQAARLAPHHERRLPVDLESWEAVDDVDAGLLECSRPLDVAAFVAARLDLDEADRLLAALRGVDQRGHERRVVAGAVHRRLDRDHLRIDRRAVDVRLEAGRERVVGVVDKKVAGADRGELLGGRLRRVPWRPSHRHPGVVLEIGPVEAAELAEIGQVELPVEPVHELVGDAQALLQLLQHRLRHRLRDLEPRHLSEARAPELELDGLEQIVGFVRHLEVAVARHAEE